MLVLALVIGSKLRCEVGVLGRLFFAFRFRSAVENKNKE